MVRLWEVEIKYISQVSYFGGKLCQKQGKQAQSGLETMKICVGRKYTALFILVLVLKTLNKVPHKGNDRVFWV